MIKLQDFARAKGVTDRAIQKHLQNHAEELEGHFERRGPGGTWLDEYAQDFISGLMYQSPMIISDMELQLKYDALRDKYEALKEKLVVALESASDVGALKARLEAAEAHQRLLEDSKAEYKADAEKARLEAKAAAEELSESRIKAVELRHRAETAEAKVDALLNRTFWQRLTKQGEKR